VKKKIAHIISTTHWDREWYWPHEKFRVRLVDLMDDLIDIFHTDENYKYYTLDGQVIPLDDYLEIKPEKRKEVEELIKNGKLLIGPWYVLPDVFLISGESIIRNLLVGFNEAKKYGNVMKVGYLPDSFGHIDQMPQILNGFELKDYFFMRGMGKEYKKIGSEFIWSTVDGSSLFTTYLNEGYFSAGGLGFPDAFMDFKDMTPDFNLAHEQMEKMLDKFSKYYKGNHYLLFNGSDHTTPQEELPKIIDFLNEKFKDIHFVHSTIKDYVDAVLAEGRKFPEYQGEFTGNMNHLAVRGVYSSRMYLKQKNFYSQALLEKYAEPISTMLFLENEKDYHSNIYYAWKQLMQNHPHDDISGCSTDDVHRAMVNRNEKVDQVGEFVFEKGLKSFSKKIKTNSELGNPFIIYNPLNWNRKEFVRTKVTLPEEYKGVKNFILKDHEGNTVPMHIHGIKNDYYPEINTWKYLPTLDIEFIADVPSFGYAVYYISTEIEKKLDNGVEVSENTLENKYYKVTATKNGSLIVVDKRTSTKYKDFNMFEDTEDDGDEFNYSFVENSKTFTTKNKKANISIYEKSPLSATLRIKLDFQLPESLHDKRTKRSKKMVSNKIVSYVTLKAHSKHIDIKTVFDNNAKDHRLRVMFPSKFKKYKNYVDGHCNVVERPKYFEDIPKERGKIEYFSTQHQGNFVTLTDGKHAITIANKGLPEYEISDDSTILVTLLRSVGYINKNNLMTRWRMAGPDIATPEAQCLGKNTFNYSIILHKKSWENSYKEAFQYIYLMRGYAIENSLGSLCARQSILNISPNTMILSAVKKAEDGNGIIARFYNITKNASEATIEFYKNIQKCYITNMLEENKSECTIDNGKNVKIKVPKNKIITMRILF
jgi:mannosylglycerate hydrolase